MPVPGAAVHGAIDAAFNAHLERARSFLRLRGVSRDRSGLAAPARWLGAYLDELGAQVTFEGSAEAPLVYARIDVGAAKTLLVYGMYDVQPVGAQEPQWISDPFGADIRYVEGVGECIVARGACNSKGPLVGFLNALAALRAIGGIPVNLIFTIEGEEETGSASLPSFYRENRAVLSGVDAAFEPFWAEYGTDVQRPALALGCKGVAVLSITCAAGDWGGPSTNDVHSSVGSLVASPAWRLLRALSSIVDSADRLVVDGLAPQTPSADDERLLANLAAGFSQEAALRQLGARRFRQPAATVDLLREHLYSTTAHVSGIDIGDGDVIPANARAGLVLRLAPGVSPGDALDSVRNQLRRNGYGDLAVEQEVAYPGSRTPLNEPVIRSMLDSYADFGVHPDIWPLLASATPYYLFSEVLQIPYVVGGLGRAGGSHAPNEFASVEGLRLLEKSLATFLLRFAAS